MNKYSTSMGIHGNIVNSQIAHRSDDHIGKSSFELRQ